MRPAPVRRAIAVAGLLGLVPIALALYAGQLSAVEAATRGLLVLGAVVALTRMVGWGLMRVLRAIEQDEEARRRARAAQPATDGGGSQ